MAGPTVVSSIREMSEAKTLNWSHAPICVQSCLDALDSLMRMEDKRSTATSLSSLIYGLTTSLTKTLNATFERGVMKDRNFHKL